MHHVVGIGHWGTKTLLATVGIEGDVGWERSMGWGDPSGWRGVRRMIAEFGPTHVHAWAGAGGRGAGGGVCGIVATAVSGFSGGRMATFSEAPREGAFRLLRIVDGRGGPADSRWRWVGSSSSIVRTLLKHGLSGDRVIRIRPGVRMANGSAGANESPGAVKESLGIAAEDGPIILLGGEGRNARHDYGLWAGAILQQIFLRTRVIVRDDPRRGGGWGVDEGLNRFAGALPTDDMLVIAPAERTWGELLRVADLMLVTPDGSIPTGSILAAMAAGVPVIGTPVECVSELIQQGHNGLLAKAVKPRAIASRLEEFMADATLRWPLTDRARADVYEHFAPSAMVEGYRALYAGAEANVPALPTSFTSPEFTVS